MEYLLKWFGFDVQDVIFRRKMQLEQQSEIDSKLKTLPCQEVVARYLLQQRELNRQMCQEYDRIGYTEYYSLTKDQLNYIDKELERVKSLITKGDCCRKL